MPGKHTFFLAAFLTAISCANAQHIYTISFEDTDDDKIGAGCTIDQRNIRRYFQRIATDLGYTPVSFDYSSESFNAQNFGSFIDKVETSPEDIILFYISSHGARSDKDKTKYPQVYLKGQMRSVYEKYDQLRKLPHKTLITLIDACNVIRNISPKEATLFNKTYTPDSAKANNDIERRNIKKLLCENGFDLIVTSSQVGVTSLSTIEGSVFTNSFIASFNYYLTTENIEYVSVKNLLTRAKDYTLNESKRLYINNNVPITAEEQPHYPIWDIQDMNHAMFTKDISASKYDIHYTVKKLSLIEKIRYRTNNDYKIDITLTGDTSAMNAISNVKYYLHHSFARPIVDALDKENSYKYTLFVWGKFLLRSELTLKDGSQVDLAKYLKF